MSGIYQIYNPINNKRYIGSSINVERRLKEHLRNLEKNRHCNDHLQSAYNKYKDVLQFQFLEECEPDECLIFEQYYLDYYKSYIREFGYNIDPEAKYAGKHLSEETKEKIRQKALCRKISKETIEKIRLKNLGKKRPKQSDKMKSRWDITKQYFGYNCMSEEKKKEVIDKIRIKTIERYKDYRNKRNNIYMPGTANHELGHVADGLAGSRKIQDFDSGKEYITNTYLNYLANPNNAYSSAELRKMGLFDAAGSRAYLLNPTEAKSHMLTLKRSLKDSGKITNWSTPVDEKMILEYMRNPTSNKMVKNQYDLYRNKNEYIDRLNKLIPMEILMPLGGAGFAGYELNKE